MDDSELIQSITEAFRNRKVPQDIIGTKQITDEVIEDVSPFQDRKWDEITAEILEKHSCVLYWLSPQAFCYFLQSFMVLSIQEKYPFLHVVDSLVMVLDRSPARESWDDFFAPRWMLLTKKELLTVQHWILWLIDSGYVDIWGNILSRAFDTIELLLDRNDNT